MSRALLLPLVLLLGCPSTGDKDDDTDVGETDAPAETDAPTETDVTSTDCVLDESKLDSCTLAP